MMRLGSYNFLMESKLSVKFRPQKSTIENILSGDIIREFRGKLQDQVDASVFVEHLLPSQGRKKYQQLREDCRRYILRLKNEEIDGTMSYGGLGEIWLAIRKRIQEERQFGMLQDMNTLLHECHVRFNAPSPETYKVATAILADDILMKSSDALRLAEAVTLGKDRFVTIDLELIENKIQQNKLNLKVVYPH